MGGRTRKGLLERISLFRSCRHWLQASAQSLGSLFHTVLTFPSALVPGDLTWLMGTSILLSPPKQSTLPCHRACFGLSELSSWGNHKPRDKEWQRQESGQGEASAVPTGRQRERAAQLQSRISFCCAQSSLWGSRTKRRERKPPFVWV